MKKCSLITLAILFSVNLSFGQFAPPAGQTGSTAVHRDSSIIVGWAATCQLSRGPQDISNTGLGLTVTGSANSATGKSGTNGVVSLGDGGSAVLQFNSPIMNGAGWDFAVYENSFNDSFLELAFVEVSSDGVHFFRFPPTSNTQDTMQIDGFGFIDARKINNLAGKYRGTFGTPFDLEELKNEQGLDVNNITHVKIIDVVGCIKDTFATYDFHGNKINDPWPTPFEPGGFDLDAVQQGNGLKNMRYRAEEIDATLLIEASKEKGTSIALLLPSSVHSAIG